VASPLATGTLVPVALGAAGGLAAVDAGLGLEAAGLLGAHADAIRSAVRTLVFARITRSSCHAHEKLVST
jgi:hypothetical protein